MATEAENIATALLQISAQIVELTANPKPSYSIGGVQVSWGEHMSSLLAMQKQLREQLVMAGDGGFEFRQVIR